MAIVKDEHACATELTHTHTCKHMGVVIAHMGVVTVYIRLVVVKFYHLRH